MTWLRPQLIVREAWRILEVESLRVLSRIAAEQIVEPERR